MIYSVPFPATCFVDCKAPNILFRSRRLFFCATGLRLIDSLFTIASGQRDSSITLLSTYSSRSLSLLTPYSHPTPIDSSAHRRRHHHGFRPILSCIRPVQDKPHAYHRLIHVIESSTSSYHQVIIILESSNLFHTS